TPPVRCPPPWPRRAPAPAAGAGPCRGTRGARVAVAMSLPQARNLTQGGGRRGRTKECGAPQLRRSIGNGGGRTHTLQQKTRRLDRRPPSLGLHRSPDQPPGAAPAGSVRSAAVSSARTSVAWVVSTDPRLRTSTCVGAPVRLSKQNRADSP